MIASVTFSVRLLATEKTIKIATRLLIGIDVLIDPFMAGRVPLFFNQSASDLLRTPFFADKPFQPLARHEGQYESESCPETVAEQIY